MHDTEGGGKRNNVRRWLPVADASHQYPRVTSARTLSALFDVIVGLRLLMPDDILGNPMSPAYRLMDKHFYGDLPLGLALLAFGVAMTVGLYTDRWSRIVGTATWLSLLTWLLVSIDISLVSVTQIGSLVYLLVAVLHGYAYAYMREWQDQLRRQGPR